MASLSANPTTEQPQALEQSHGFFRGSSYVLRSLDRDRELMGVGTDEELASSIQAITEAMQDFDVGRSIPLEEAQRRLDQKQDGHR